MAFSFVVETGVADSDANSYCSVDFADDYIEANTYASATWLALDEDIKERFLVRASRIIDRRVKWVGQRYDPDQGLKWPRSDTYDEDGYPIGDDTVPEVVKEAVCEFVSFLINDDWTAPQDTQGLREIKVDVIDLKIDQTFTRTAFPDVVRAIIENSGLGTLDDGSARTRFKPIIRS